MRDLHVEREQSGLALGDLLAERVGLRLGEGALGDLELGSELLQLGVLPVHRLDQVGLAELDVADARRLEDAAARVLVGVHLHHGLVDRRVDDDPRAAAQLAVRRDVHEDRLLVVAQVVDDEGAELEDLAVHVTRAAREAAPVGEDHHGQVLAREVVDGLRRLVGRVGVPHLARLGEDGLARGGVGGVGGDALLDQARLDGDAAHGHATQLAAADHDGLAPVGEVLGERALVEEARLPLAAVGGVGRAGEHVARVVRRLGRLEGDRPLDGVARGRDRDLRVGRVRHIAQPAEDLLDAVLVVGGELVGDAVGQHDLRAAQLVLRDVDLLAEQLVERGEASENDRPVGHLDHALRQPVDVRADAHRAAGHVREREGLGVGLRGLAGDEAGAAQVLDADAVLLAHDVVELVPLLAALGDELAGDHALGQLGEVLLSQVEVLVAVLLLGGVVPRDLEVGLHLVGQADARARVGGDVQARVAARARVLGDLVEEVVLLHAEGAGLHRAVVGDDDERAALGVLGRLERQVPADHADGVLADDARAAHELVAALVEQLVDREQRERHLRRRAVGDGSLPLRDERLLDEPNEVVRVRGADAARDRALVGERGRRGVRLDVAHLVAALVRDGAVARGLARLGVDVLEVAVRLEPLARHGGGHQAHRLLAVALDRGRAHLDLVDAQVEQPRRVLGDERRHDLLVALDHLLRRGAEGREHVQEEVRRRRGAHVLVEHRQLQLVERLEQRGLGAAGVGAHGAMCHAAHVHALLLARAGALRAEEDHRVVRDRGDALGRPVLEAAHLEQVPHGRVHVAPRGDLVPVRVDGERVLARPLGRVGHHERDEAHPLGVERRLVLLEQRGDARDQCGLLGGAARHALAQRDVQLVDRLRDVVEAAEERGQLRLERGERGDDRELAAAHRQRSGALRVVGALVLEVGDDGVADGGGLELLDVEGAVEALDRHLHRRLADLLVAEECEQRVDHEAAADGGRVGARGLELGLELGHHLLEGLLRLVEAELRRGERDLLVRAAGELAQLRDHVERLGQLAERRDAEALGEAVQLAQQRDRERRARLERLVRDRRGDDAVEAVGVRLDQRGHRLVGGRLREEALLHAEVAAEERAHGGYGVVPQAVGVRVEDRGDRRERRGHPLLLGLVLVVDEVGDRLLELLHQHERLRGVLALLVHLLRLGVQRLQLRVELDGQLLAERGGRVLHLAHEQVDARQRREHLLHERVDVLDDVAVHDQLEALERRAVGLERGLTLLRTLLVVELALEDRDLLDLARVLERERREQVALVDDRAGLLLVRDGARLGRLDRDEHLHRLRLGKGRARLHLRAVLDQVAHELARDVGAQL
mmetsp:Transcript_32105/g.81796  ORF Transcript_32105/g.81796 Transcript_32105/m.81796 type:complete len:1343 (-) Transcript_32105:2244-6272(-)